MYRNIRVLGLLTAPPLLMYSVSAIQMGHRSWFNLKTTVITDRFAFDSDCSNPREMAASLMRSLHWRGELTLIAATPAGCSLEVSSTGTTWEVRYVTASKEMSIRTSRVGIIGMLNRMHHAAGLWHPSRALATWSVGVALTSLSLGSLIVTGVWLWMLRKRERILGLILVAANFSFSATMLVLLRQ